MADFTVFLGEEHNFTATTTDPDGDNWEARWRAQPPFPAPPQPWDAWDGGDYPSGGTSAPRSVLFNVAGDWVVQAQARDVHGAQSAISTVTVEVVEPQNDPPADPTITCWVFSGSTWNQAGQGTVNQTIQVRASTIDPDGDQWYMRFRKFPPGGSSSLPTAWDGPFDNGQFATCEVFVDTPGTWYFYAQAKDDQEPPNYSNWAIIPFVATAPDTTPPAPPNTPSGDNELNTGEIGHWTTTTADNSMQWQIQWWAGQDDPANAVPITVDGFGNPTWVGPGDDPGEYFENNELASIAHSFPVGDCDWYIGAAAKDPSGNVANAENWKKVTVVELGDTEPPTDPLTPWLHGSAYANSDVILVTTATDNSGSYRVKMQVQWVLDPLAYTHNTEYGNPVPSGREAEVTVTLPTMVGFYRAKAMATDESGNESDWSPWFLFYAAQADIYVPTVPTVPELIDGDLVAGTPGTFSTVSYIDGGEQWQVKWEVNGEDMGWTTTQDSGVAALTSVLFTYGDFEIRARARNATHTTYQSDWSQPFTGTVSDPVPLKPIKPYALDSLLANTPIRFATSSYDNTGWYWLRWEINGSQQTWEEANQVANGVLGLLTLTPDEGTLTLRAQAKDVNNQESPWSNPATFIVEAIQERTRLTVHRVWVELKERRSRR